MPGTLTTMQCPKCGQSILSTSPACQFCGTILQQAPRGRAAFMAPADDKKTWQEITYWVLAGIWVLYGTYYMAQGLGWIPISSADTKAAAAASAKLGPYIGSIGGVFLFIGIGLFFETGWIQFVTKLACWLGLAASICWIPQILFMKHPLVPLLEDMLQIGLLAMQLHVLAVVGDA